MGFEGRPRTHKRTPISLVCMVCGTRNYRTNKSRRDGLEPLILKKYCPGCNQHTEHREAK